MKRALALAIFLSAFAGWGGAAPLQDAAGAQSGSAIPASIPAYDSIYCSGFIREQALQEGLFVLAGEEGGVTNEFVPGDIVYLSKGAGWIVRPGGEYMVLRRVYDVNRQEAFPGQQRLLKQLGVLYAEIGRLHVNIVLEHSATAQVMQACDSISVGDIAVPFDVKPAPVLRPSTTFDRFAPPTGKTGGMIVTSKEFGMMVRAGEVAYLDIGAKDGVAVGQYYRVYRPFAGSNLDLNRKYRNSLPEKIGGLRLTVHLSPEMQRNLPRDVLGEMVILHVEGRSATGLVTYANRDIFAGDQVELE